MVSGGNRFHSECNQFHSESNEFHLESSEFHPECNQFPSKSDEFPWECNRFDAECNEFHSQRNSFAFEWNSSTSTATDWMFGAMTVRWPAARRSAIRRQAWFTPHWVWRSGRRSNPDREDVLTHVPRARRSTSRHHGSSLTRGSDAMTVCWRKAGTRILPASVRVRP